MINKEIFLNQFKEVLELDSYDLTLDEPFRDLDAWDSLALLSVIAMIDDEYDVIIKGNQFKELNTLNDIITFIESQG